MSSGIGCSLIGHWVVLSSKPGNPAEEPPQLKATGSNSPVDFPAATSEHGRCLTVCNCSAIFLIHIRNVWLHLAYAVSSELTCPALYLQDGRCLENFMLVQLGLLMSALQPGTIGTLQLHVNEPGESRIWYSSEQTCAVFSLCTYGCWFLAPRATCAHFLGICLP